MKKAQKKIDLSETEIEELFQRLQDKTLFDKDYEILMGMLEVLVTLNDVVRQKDISIKRLLKRIFGNTAKLTRIALPLGFLTIVP